MKEIFNFLKKIEEENKYLKEVKTQLETKYIELQKKNDKLETILSYDSIYYKCYKCKGWFSGDYDNGLYNTPRKSWLKWGRRPCPRSDPGHPRWHWTGSEPGGVYESLDCNLKERIICVECFQKIFPYNSNGEVINTETGEINPNLFYGTEEGSFPSKGIYDFDYYIINPDNLKEAHTKPPAAETVATDESESDDDCDNSTIADYRPDMNKVRAGHLYYESLKPVSDELCKFLNLGTNYIISYYEVSRRIGDYCKINNLRDPIDRVVIIPDTPLRNILKIDENTEITWFTLGKYIRKIY